MKITIYKVKVLILNLILALIFSCEPESITDGQITGTSKCYDIYVLYYYNIDNNQCDGETSAVNIRTNEKYRLESILANTTDDCVRVEIKYYFLGIKAYVNGYIKNSSSTFKQIVDCN
jgi:hypothetical protein